MASALEDERATRLTQRTGAMRAPIRGELLGIPATGKHVRVGSISIFRVAGGKITENWEQWDRLALLQQLGVLPAPAAPAARRPSSLAAVGCTSTTCGTPVV
jgi:SnoaL-like polyketide cyclase